MTDWSALAAWLRQRPDETDQQWVVRLGILFEETVRDRAVPRVDDPKMLRIMDRVWRRYVTALKAPPRPRGDDI